MTNGTQYWYLKDHQLFRHLNLDDLKQVCFMSKFKIAKKGEIIFFNDENKGLMFTLKKGSLKIVRISENGDEIVKDVLKKGDLFGQLSLDGSSDSDEYAVVLSDQVVFCSFESDAFEKLMEQKPDLALKYTKWIGFWFKRLENRYSNIMFKDVRTRLINFFKDVIIDAESDTYGNINLPNYLTHQDLASLICSTRQTVTSLLNTLKTDGVISYSRKEISVNKEKLLSLQ
jgi:CRP/FNR family transcriptional regulator, cyclic AMP receptor protein